MDKRKGSNYIYDRILRLVSERLKKKYVKKKLYDIDSVKSKEARQRILPEAG